MALLYLVYYQLIFIFLNFEDKQKVELTKLLVLWNAITIGPRSSSFYIYLADFFKPQPSFTFFSHQ